jgi:hypothetical protein
MTLNSPSSRVRNGRLNGSACHLRDRQPSDAGRRPIVETARAFLATLMSTNEEDALALKCPIASARDDAKLYDDA